MIPELPAFIRSFDRQRLGLYAPLEELVRRWQDESSRAGEDNHARGSYVGTWAQRAAQFLAASSFR